jgi:hypothetical protein
MTQRLYIDLAQQLREAKKDELIQAQREYIDFLHRTTTNEELDNGRFLRQKISQLQNELHET